VTKMRWVDGEDSQGNPLEKGPAEEAHEAELVELGWKRDVPGKLSSLATIVLSLAETLDHTQAARDKATVANQLAARMTEARAAAGEKRGKLSVVEQAQARGAGRRPGTPGSRPAAGR
jgi:hypothetical protein